MLRPTLSAGFHTLRCQLQVSYQLRKGFQWLSNGKSLITNDHLLIATIIESSYLLGRNRKHTGLESLSKAVSTRGINALLLKTL